MSVQPSTARTYSGGGSVFLGNLRIGPKIIVGYLLLIILMAGVAGVAYWGMGRIRAADELALERESDVANLWAMQMYMIEQAGQSAHLIINDDPSAIEAFRASAEAMNEKMELVQEDVDTAEEQQLIADIDRIDEQYDVLFFEQVVPAWEAGDKELLKTLDDQSDALLTQMDDKAHQMIASFEAEVVEAQATAEETHRQTTLLMVGISIAAAVIGLGFGFVLSRSISGPVQVVTQAAARLAEQDLPRLVQAIQAAAGGDLTATFQLQPDFVEIRSRDEVGQMARAFNNMNEALGVVGENFAGMLFNLRDLIGQVQEGADQVTTSSQQMNIAAEQAGQAGQQVATTIQQVANGTAQQTQSVTEATSNVEQMARAADGIARGAQEQAQGVQNTSDLIGEMAGIVDQVGQVAGSVSGANAKAAEAARHGVTVVEQTGKGMDTIRIRTTTAAEKVKEMGTRSKEIGRIVETIDDIADKTDMLALNAAVEAARAGEHGRGFAVVADQVRKLSEDSKGATRDIGELIERVQDTVDEAVAAMESTVAEVDTGARLAGDTAQSLQEILQAAEDAAVLAEQINSAVAQLKQKSEGVVGAVESVSTVVEENTAVAEEMAANSQEVTDAMEGIASVAEENSASAEEVSASAEEMSAQVEEVVASAEELAALAEQLRAAAAQFRVDGAEQVQPDRWGSRPERNGAPVGYRQPQAVPALAGQQGDGYGTEPQ